MDQYYSSIQAARMLGVSPSTIKRMCDESSLETLRTPGGHRRISRQSLLAFLQENDVLTQAEPGPKRVQSSLTPTSVLGFLLAGDSDAIATGLLTMQKAGHALTDLFDDLISPVMWRVGNEWQAGTMEVYQEHLCSSHLRAALLSVRSQLVALAGQRRSGSDQETSRRAIGCAVGSEQHDLPSLMIDILLLQKGWKTQNLGGTMPVESLLCAIEHGQPNLVWVSYTFLPDPERAIENHARIAAAMKGRGRLVIGGQALTASVRRELEFDFAGDSFRHLMAYVSAMAPCRSA